MKIHLGDSCANFSDLGDFVCICHPILVRNKKSLKTNFTLSLNSNMKIKTLKSDRTELLFCDRYVEVGTSAMGEDFRKIRVLNTFTLQRIIDSEDVEGRLEIQGTFVQSALDLKKEEAEEFCNRENGTAFFGYRCNQQFATEENVEIRRIDLEEVLEVDEDGNPKLDENGKKIIACYGCRTTMKVRIPLKVELVASAFPFEVSRLDATIELRSTLLNGERVRGDLLLHESDP